FRSADDSLENGVAQCFQNERHRMRGLQERAVSLQTLWCQSLVETTNNWGGVDPVCGNYCVHNFKRSTLLALPTDMPYLENSAYQSHHDRNSSREIGDR